MFTKNWTSHSGKGREPQMARELQGFQQWFETFQPLSVLKAQADLLTRHGMSRGFKFEPTDRF